MALPAMGTRVQDENGNVYNKRRLHKNYLSFWTFDGPRRTSYRTTNEMRLIFFLQTKYNRQFFSHQLVFSVSSFILSQPQAVFFVYTDGNVDRNAFAIQKLHTDEAANVCGLVDAKEEFIKETESLIVMSGSSLRVVQVSDKVIGLDIML